MTERAESARAKARSPGWWLQLVGVAHAGVGVALYRRPLLTMARMGVLASVPDRGERATAFWFLTNAPVLWTAGRLLAASEHRGDTDGQRAAGVALIGVGSVGAIAAPVSGFWAIATIGVAALRRGRHHRL